MSENMVSLPLVGEVAKRGGAEGVVEVLAVAEVVVVVVAGGGGEGGGDISGSRTVS